MTFRLFDGYARLVRDAVTHRRQAARPPIKALVLIATVGLVLYVLKALLFVPAGHDRSFNFTNEDGPITALSAICLAMASGFAFAAFYATMGTGPRDRLFWLVLALGLGFLAFDELLEFHERVGLSLDRVDPLGLVARAGFRTWNDIVIVLYGLLAAPTMIYFLPAAARHPRCLETISVAFAFYCLHTIIDATQEPPTDVSYILEETCKLCTSATLALAMFIGLVSVVSNRTWPLPDLREKSVNA